jgi:hypothetical protein
VPLSPPPLALPRRSREFHEVEGDDIRGVLEEALHAYCTLSEGDWLQVERGGQQHDMQVGAAGGGCGTAAAAAGVC